MMTIYYEKTASASEHCQHRTKLQLSKAKLTLFFSHQALEPIGTTADDLTNAVQGKHFKVLFAYKAAFRGELNLREGEIIIGKERDRNGWMLGTKLKAKEEGWFPAVYVDQVVGELPKEEMPDLHTEKMELDQEVYGQLAVNRNKSPDQAWLGIEHIANYAYKGTSEIELKFKKGDILVIFEAQESGWWLGCHGDNVGWFPGAFVELLEQKSDSDGIALELLSPQLRNKDGSSKDTQSQRSSTASNSSDTPKDLADVKSSVSVSSESIIGDKPKPSRKAPQPPGADKSSGNGATVVVSGTGTLSRNLRPVRPAPAPPVHKVRPESVSSMDKLGVRMNQDTDETSSTKLKPLKKTRKPIIVRIPKEKVGLDKISSCAMPKRPVPSIHEQDEQQKNKDDCAKQDKDDHTKSDSDLSGDSEIEKGVFFVGRMHDKACF
ncbi:CD2-associated protein-like isoform X1 [Pomacea canaliculata]|uniref:CD2-associated protein-like isoform X1 n=1 Tax=Pomacea canaliculata TaxID=400727 RepID=UPI000D72A0F8|nr:CD2-associated protein-like isoform X1 [Pomacea canaliculata]